MDIDGMDIWEKWPLERPRLTILGDAILDRYVFGFLERISPEAPVPVFRAERTIFQPGGAAGVACMAAALGAHVELFTRVGQDFAGVRLVHALRNANVFSDAAYFQPDFSTPIKTRFIAGGRIIFRGDRETSLEITPQEREEILEKITESAPSILLVADYGKGFCSEVFLSKLIQYSRAHHIPILIDPHHRTPWEAYRGATVLLPNRREAAEKAFPIIKTPDQAEITAKILLRQYAVENIVLKLDRDGLFFVNSKMKTLYVPTRPRRPLDPTGAGDMILAVVGFLMASFAAWPNRFQSIMETFGGYWETILKLANRAAGLKLRHWGCKPIRLEKILHDPQRPKILSLDSLLAKLATHRKRGRIIVFTNGCFDLLHPGHLRTLHYAKQQGDILVVGVNSDRSVRELKGERRPVIPEAKRAEMLAALECVDYVVVFDSASVLPLVEKIRPDCLVKGGKELLESVVGADFVRSYGGRVILAPVLEGYSTTLLVASTG